MTRRLFLSALAAVAAGCGYARTGRGIHLPSHVVRIGVPMFENHSNTEDLDRILTEAVRSELRGRGRFRVEPDANGVDAVLTATLRPMSVVPASYTATQQASRYLVTVLASVEFRITKDDSVFWSDRNVRVSDEYDYTGALAAADVSTIFTQDRNALERLSRTFARTVVTSILENF